MHSHEAPTDRQLAMVKWLQSFAPSIPTGASKRDVHRETERSIDEMLRFIAGGKLELLVALLKKLSSERKVAFGRLFFDALTPEEVAQFFADRASVPMAIIRREENGELRHYTNVEKREFEDFIFRMRRQIRTGRKAVRELKKLKLAAERQLPTPPRDG